MDLIKASNLFLWTRRSLHVHEYTAYEVVCVCVRVRVRVCVIYYNFVCPIFTLFSPNSFFPSFFVSLFLLRLRIVHLLLLVYTLLVEGTYNHKCLFKMWHASPLKYSFHTVCGLHVALTVYIFVLLFLCPCVPFFLLFTCVHISSWFSP